MQRRTPRALLPIAVGIVVTLVVMAAVALRWVDRDRTARAPDGEPAPQAVASAAPGDRSKPLFSSSDEPDGGTPKDRPPSEDPLETTEYPKGSWEGVDLEQLRTSLPDNLYWEMSLPTKDPEILRKRQEERDRWNVEYGKVLSNTATAEEIDAYYAHRQRLSQDYLEFVVTLLETFGYQIPARDVALLKLAAEMHNARLEEIPRQIAEAHQRREAHEAARQAWLAEQRAFEGEPPDAE